MPSMRIDLSRIFILTSLTFALAGCGGNGTIFPGPSTTTALPTILGGAIPAPVIRQPVLPEYLVGCRGHVLVPALGMLFVAKAKQLPTSGQFLREESLSAPYRIVHPGDRQSQDRNGQRLNVELDNYSRIIGLACG